MTAGWALQAAEKKSRLPAPCCLWITMPWGAGKPAGPSSLPNGSFPRRHLPGDSALRKHLGVLEILSLRQTLHSSESSCPVPAPPGVFWRRLTPLCSLRFQGPRPEAETPVVHGHFILSAHSSEPGRKAIQSSGSTDVGGLLS